MRISIQAGIFLGCGLLLVLFGSAPLNGYFGFLFWPNEFHTDASIGSILHLLIGLIPWLVGIVLITLGAVKAWHVLVIWLVSLGLGSLLSLSATINATDHTAYLGWLAIVTIGVILAAAIRQVVNLIWREQV